MRGLAAIGSMPVRLNYKIMEAIIYKGYLIEPVYSYTNGKSDFQVFPDEGREQGSIYPSTTLEKIKAEIDEETN